jgi:hypothetical protein
MQVQVEPEGWGGPAKHRIRTRPPGTQIQATYASRSSFYAILVEGTGEIEMAPRLI